MLLILNRQLGIQNAKTCAGNMNFKLPDGYSILLFSPNIWMGKKLYTNEFKDYFE